MTVLADIASAPHSKMIALAPTSIAGIPLPVLSIKLNDRFGNARTSSGDGRQTCVRVRPVNSSDSYSCSICTAQPTELNETQYSSQCQLGWCGRICSSGERGFELFYNGSVASQVVMEALLVASGFVSCGSGTCVPVAACSNIRETLSVHDRCSALNVGNQIGRPSLLTVVPGRAGPPFLFCLLV